MKFEAVDERLCYLRLKGRFKNISIISIYAPTEESDDEAKEMFYTKLDTLFQSIPNYDYKLIMGDANAKVGQEDRWRPTIGKQSLHSTSNDNGVRLITFATAADLCIASTMFPHKDIHKGTWISPGGKVVNQIDHVLVDSRHRKIIEDVRSLRSAECGSDHYLVLVKVKQRISTSRREKHKVQKKICFEKLKESELVDTLREELDNRFEELEEIQSTSNSETVEAIEEQWSTFKNVIKETAKKVLDTSSGYREKKPWFDRDCEEIMEKRVRAKQQWLSCDETRKDEYREKYNKINREVVKLVRQKKRQYVKKSLEKAEEDRTKNNTKDFYRTVRFFKNGYRPRTSGVKDRDGNTTNEPEKVLNIWKEYFEDLLNVNPETESDVNGESTHEIRENNEEIEEPTLREVKDAIDNMKNGKSPGEDGIPVEIFKYGGEGIKRYIHKLIILIWRKETIPKEWNEAVVVPLHKKGDKLECNNYRGISLLNTTYKILSKIILKRLKRYENEIIGDHQAGFVKERSTVDQIFAFKEIVSKYWEYNQEVHALFIDFKKAYDCIRRDYIWKTMSEFGIPKKLIELCKICVVNSKAKVRVEGEYTETFLVNTGVRQGDGISPLLFNIVLEKTLRKTKSVDKGVNFGPTINLLAFADDIVLLAEKEEDLVSLAELLITEAKKVGLNVSCEKTKYMRIGGITQTVGNLKVGEYQFQSCKEFKYLGVTITDTVTEQTEIENRLAAANRCFWSVQKLMSSKLLSRTTKLRIYKTIIQPVLLYGSEVWTLSKVSEKKLVTFENKILRKIYGPVYENGTWRIKKNKEIRELFNEPDIVANIRCRRMRWTGHVLRRDDESLIKSVWEGELTGTRRRGRPKLRWKDQIKRDMAKINTTEEDAQDRTVWRGKIGEAKSLLGFKWPWQ
ncbi:hypothetical protein M8J77_009060 [Diaphorina citri]|nr:hypothetical protein M8J77_009060 [Diaphorina citri]